MRLQVRISPSLVSAVLAPNRARIGPNRINRVHMVFQLNPSRFQQGINRKMES